MKTTYGFTRNQRFPDAIKNRKTKDSRGLSTFSLFSSRSTVSRGELRDHVMSIIIGVVSLSLLLLAAWYLMQAYTMSDYDRADSALDTIKLKLRAVDYGETTRFPLQGPSGWYLQGWSVTESGRPERCYFKSCICICKEAGTKGAESCQDTKSATCISVEEKELFVGSEIYRLTLGSAVGGGVNMPSAASKISETRERCPRIPFRDALIEVVLTKEKNKLDLVQTSDEAIDFEQECLR